MTDHLDRLLHLHLQPFQVFPVRLDPVAYLPALASSIALLRATGGTNVHFSCFDVPSPCVIEESTACPARSFSSVQFSQSVSQVITKIGIKMVDGHMKALYYDKVGD